jgi:hypothetical protein
MFLIQMSSWTIINAITRKEKPETVLFMDFSVLEAELFLVYFWVC